ncbi:hypothetical protein GCM10028805_54060 [Spirosoma harenae]
MNSGGRIDGRKPVDEITQKAINEYYQTHTIDETAHHFGVHRSTVKRHTEKKRQLLTDEEKAIKNYRKIRDRRQRLKQMGVDYLGGRCNRCGYDRSIWALQFHHRDPTTKAFTLGQYNNISWHRFKHELDKCELLCANCHAEVHQQEYIDPSLN